MNVRPIRPLLAVAVITCLAATPNLLGQVPKPSEELAITLGVEELTRSLSFYRDGLGFQQHNYTEGDQCIMFRLEGTWLAIYPRESLAEDAELPSEGPVFPGFTLAHNVKTRNTQTRSSAKPWQLAQPLGSRHKTSPGAAILGTLPIQMDSYGR
jgi:hypothetical protein